MQAANWEKQSWERVDDGGQMCNKGAYLKIQKNKGKIWHLVAPHTISIPSAIFPLLYNGKEQTQCSTERRVGTTSTLVQGFNSEKEGFTL